MSMISEQVIELRDWAISLKSDQEEMLADVISQAADTIEELSAKLEAANAEKSDGGWILCSDRLPRFNDNVLICFDFKGRRSIEFGCFWSDGSPHCDSDEYLTPSGREERKAVAWMELPKPYKGEIN